jgi:vacuolar-type H+-ATPase subunit E/Vma4
MTLAARQQAALEPVRAAMLRRATQDAAAAVATARNAAAAMIAQAQADADALVAQATAEGAAQAAPVAMAELTRARQAARSVTLGADLAIRDQVVMRMKAAVLALRDEPDYPRLLERLSVLAASAAGPGAVITAHPDGGVVATSGGVKVNCSLPRLADRAVAVLDAQITALCGSADSAVRRLGGEQ